MDRKEESNMLQYNKDEIGDGTMIFLYKSKQLKKRVQYFSNK